MKKAIVIGAGFGGIASAIRLIKKGYKVELIDRCNNLGGRAQFFNINGFKYDAGPTIITAPFLFKELFSIHNKKLENYIALKPLDVWYRFVFSDGTYFDSPSQENQFSTVYLSFSVNYNSENMSARIHHRQFSFFPNHQVATCLDLKGLKVAVSGHHVLLG